MARASQIPPSMHAEAPILEVERCLGQGSLPRRLRDAMALRVCQMHRTGDRLPALTAAAADTGLEPDDIRDFLRGISRDPKEQALLALTTKVLEDQGHHAGFVVARARDLGVTDAEIAEALALIALYTYQNHLHLVLGKDRPDRAAISNGCGGGSLE